MNKTSKKYRTICIYLFLAAATFALFYQVCNYDFVSYDDPKYVFDNKNIQEGLTPDAVKWAFTATHASNWHPLTWLSHILDYQLFQAGPAGHHLISLLLHIINTLLLFAILKNMTGALWPSAFVAAAFALHPLHVESVAWVSERKDVLSTFFWMLTIAAYLRYVRHSRLHWYLLTLVIFALGLMAKPMLVTLPLVLLLLDYWPLNRLQKKTSASATGPRKKKSMDTRFKINIYYRCIWEKIPFLMLSALSSFVTFIVQRNAGIVADIYRLPVKLRIANALISYTKYIQKMFWPTKLAILYPYDVRSLTFGAALASAVLLLTISFFVIRFSKKHGYLTLGWLWYLGTLLPVIGLVQVGNQALADRYTYIPFIGLFIIIAWAVNDIFAKWQNRKIVLTLSAVIALSACSVCTFLQLTYWRNTFTLLEHALEVTSQNSIVHYNLACAFQDQAKLEEAVFHYRRAVHIDPKYAEAHNNLGSVLSEQGKSKEAIYHLRQAIKIKPDYPQAHNNLGTVLKLQGNIAQAVTHFNKALETNPDSAQAHNNLGIALRNQNKLDQAIEHFRYALRINPDYAEAHNNIALVFDTQDRPNEAIEHFLRALQLKPDYAQAHYNLANSLASQRKFDQALPHFQKAIRLKPDYDAAHNNMATVLTELGRLDEAVAHFNQALSINPNNTFAYINLANSLVKQQKPDEAAAQYRRALQIDPDFVDARILLAKLLQSQAKLDGAITHYRYALRLRPDSPEIQNNLAWLLVIHPDPEKRKPAEAVVLALRSAGATRNKNPIVLNTLAAAYSLTGRLDKAIETTEKALELASTSQNQKLIDYTRTQLQHYRQQAQSASGQPIK